MNIFLVTKVFKFFVDILFLNTKCKTRLCSSFMAKIFVFDIHTLIKECL